MQPQVFRTAAAYRLGVPVVPDEIPCPLCMQTVDKLGDHASCCKKTGDNIVRHNRVRDLLARFCGEGLLSPIIECKNLLSSSAHRPGDVTIPNWHAGRPLAIDVAVTSPFNLFGMRTEDPADSYGLINKHRKYDRRFRGREPIFAALVLESTGGLSQEALSLLKSVFRFASRRQNVQHCVYVGRAWARLSCNLQTSVAQSILNRIDGSVYQRGTSARLSDYELVTVSSSGSSSSASSASVSFSEPAPVSSAQVLPVLPSVISSAEPEVPPAVVFNDHESVVASGSGPSPLSLSHSLLVTPTSSRFQRTPTPTRRPDPPFPGWIPASGSFPSPKCWSPEPFVPMTCEFHVGELHKCSECVPGLLVCQAHLVACKGLSAGICPQCQRVLCAKHLECFCSESKLWREEEKVRRNPKTSAPPSGFSRPGPSLAAFPPLVTPVSSCSRASSSSFLQGGVRDSSVSSRASPFLKKAAIFWRHLAKGEQSMKSYVSSTSGNSTFDLCDQRGMGTESSSSSLIPSRHLSTSRVCQRTDSLNASTPTSLPLAGVR